MANCGWLKRRDRTAYPARRKTSPSTQLNRSWISGNLFARAGDLWVTTGGDGYAALRLRSFERKVWQAELAVESFTRRTASATTMAKCLQDMKAISGSVPKRTRTISNGWLGAGHLTRFQSNPVAGADNTRDMWAISGRANLPYR